MLHRLGLRRVGKGVIQLLDDFADTTESGSTEFAMLRRLVEASGRPLSFTLLDISIYPGRWKTLLREVERANRDGLPIKGQVAARPVALLTVAVKVRGFDEGASAVVGTTIAGVDRLPAANVRAVVVAV